MWSVKKLLTFLMIAGWASACASGPGGSEGSPNFVVIGHGGSVTMTSHKFTPPGYPFNHFPTPPAVVPGEDPGSGEVVLDGTPTEAAPEVSDVPEPPANAPNAMITGNIVHPGYAGGDFLIETRAAVGCGDQTCPDLSGKPFASLKVAGVGYFALIMAPVDAPIFAVATYSHPTDGTRTREVELGVVAQRTNGVVFDFTPEEEPAAGEATLSPEQAKAIGDLFEKAQKAQDDLNDMVSSSLGNIF